MRYANWGYEGKWTFYADSVALFAKKLKDF